MPPESTRSRSGCLTCRDRKKKCDEKWREDGTCDRCYRGSHKCLRGVRERGAAKRGRPNANTAAGSGSAVLSSTPIIEGLSGNTSKNNENLLSTTISMALGVSLPSAYQGGNPIADLLNPEFALPTNNSVKGDKQVSHIANPPRLPTSFGALSSSIHNQSLVSNSLGTSSPSSQATSHQTFMSDLEMSSDLNSFFESLDAFSGLDFDTAPIPANSGRNGIGRMEGMGMMEDEILFDAIASTTSVPEQTSNSLVIRDKKQEQEELAREAESWASAVAMLELGKRGSNNASTNTSSALTVPPNPNGNGSNISRNTKSYDLSENDHTDVAPLYAAFNDGFFRSLPRPVREIMVRRMSRVATSSQLGASASMAMVLLYRARTQSEGNEEAQSMLLAQSDRFFQQAVLHLQAPIPLEGKIVACLDLQAHQFDLSGAAASHAVLLLSEYFITESLGQHPKMTLPNLADESNITLRCFAFGDVLRTICIRRRRPVFDFPNLPGYSSSDLTKSGDHASNFEDTIDTHLGLPIGLLLCLAATSHLAYEAGNGLDRETVQKKSREIEAAIRMWRPCSPNGVEDSSSYLERLTGFELWRIACLIYLFTAVNCLGCLATPIRVALAQFLKLATTLPQNKGPEPTKKDWIWSGAPRACPWFLASIVAFSEEDRAMCRKGLQACGPQKGYKDNLMAVQKIWDLVDQDGWCVDWREILEREKLWVAFL